MTYTQDFLSVYQHYPLKKGKFQAQRTWNKLNDKGDLPDIPTILKAIQQQKKERKYLRQQNRFVPPWKHFSTWLNSACWEDECEVSLSVARTPKKRTGGNGVGNMKRALNILTNISEEKFNEFCQAVNMPEGDKEAVLLKAQNAFNLKSITSSMLKEA